MTYRFVKSFSYQSAHKYAKYKETMTIPNMCITHNNISTAGGQ